MKLLELFSGTGSVGTVAKDMGWTVVSLDLKGADINCDDDLQSSSRLCRDILQWKYKKYPVKYWDMIWASPPCIEYSIAKQTGVRKIEEANEIVMKTLEIIKYFKPRVWFVENPQTGLLKKQSFMEGLPYFDIDYCKYGMPYRKRTRLWTNLDTWTPRPLCKKDCESMDGNRHKETAQRAPSGKKENWKEGYTLFKQMDLYRIPQALVEEIMTAVNVVCFR